MNVFSKTMLDATSHTTQGRVLEATRLIQLALRGGTPAAEAPAAPGVAKPASSLTTRAEEVAFREVRTAPEPVSRQTLTQDGAVFRRSAPRAATGSFTAHTLAHAGSKHPYHVYVPPPSAEPPALLLMLHGCKQDAVDFSLGTGMNILADRHNIVVVYPEQRTSANNMGCWNWFDPAHQSQGRGEPDMLRKLVRDILASKFCDPSRVYVAGLSAGGAMAALLGQLYPELFTAIGVHSGLPPRAASDVTSAFGAMRKGVEPRQQMTVRIPTICFHGSSDSTVAPKNATTLITEQLGAWKEEGVALDPVGSEERRGRVATRTQWIDQKGTPMLESWLVAAGPHAWSGGDRRGSFTDPSGPDASLAMVKFFLRHRRTPMRAP